MPMLRLCFLNSLFGVVKLPKNADFCKYEYSGYRFGFDVRKSFLLSDGSGFSKNVIIIRTDISSSLGVDNRRKDTLIFGKYPTQGLDNTTWTSKKEYN